MRPIPRLLLAILSVAGASTSFAAETTPARGPVATPATEPAKPEATPTVKAEGAPAPTPAKSAAAKDDPEAQGKSMETAAQAAAKSVDKNGTPQRFIPSEQVRADFDVSFPIDI